MRLTITTLCDVFIQTCSHDIFKVQVSWGTQCGAFLGAIALSEMVYHEAARRLGATYKVGLLCGKHFQPSGHTFATYLALLKSRIRIFVRRAQDLGPAYAARGRYSMNGTSR